MTSKKRLLIIRCIIFGTPIIGLCIGVLGKAIYAPQDTSGLAQAFGFFIGVLGSIGSLIFGPIVSFLMRKGQHQPYSLLGYIIPSALAILYLIALTLSPHGF